MSIATNLRSARAMSPISQRLEPEALDQVSTAEANSNLGVFAVTLATVNVVGGYMVTERMLRMFHRSDEDGRGS